MPPHAGTLLRCLRRLAAPADPDAALLARWTNHSDEAAFAELVARHGPMVLGVCRRVLGDVQHAEDAFQATFLVLARKAAALRRPEALPGFLYGVAVRLARKARGAARRRMVQSHSEVPEPADPHPHPLDVLSGRELLALLDEEVARLPEVYRLPLLLCVLQERPIEEAARILGWSSGSVRGRLARGRERLRQQLVRRGVCLSVGALALLAPAVIPERLMAASLRNLTAPAAPAVSVLAAGSASGLKLTAACLGVLLAAVALGAGLTFPCPLRPEKPAAAAPAVPPTPKPEPRRDRHGDPLPPGAVTRLGSVRFRVPDGIDSLAFAPDGKTLAVSTRAGLFLVDAVSGRQLPQHLPVPAARLRWEHPVVFSPDSKRLAGWGQAEVPGKPAKGVVRVWELAGGRKPREYDAEDVAWLGWSADGEPLAVCGETGGVRLRELATGRSRRFACKGLPMTGLFRYLPCVVADGGRILAIALEDRTVIRVWDTVTGRERFTLRPKNIDARALAISPDGRTLAFLNRADATGNSMAIQFWDTTTGKALRTLPTDDKYLFTVAFAPDGKTLAAAGWRGVHFWDVATGRKRAGSDLEGINTGSIAFSGDSKTLAAAERLGCSLHLFDVSTGKRKPAPVGHHSPPHGTAFTPDGRRVATCGSRDGTIHVWDLTTGASLARIHRPHRGARGVAYLTDGRSLYSIWNDELWFCGPATGERQDVIKLEDPERPDNYLTVVYVRHSDDGKKLVVLSTYGPKKVAGPYHDDTLITAWDLSTRKQLFRRRRPGKEPWTVLSSDARVLAVAHARGSRDPGQHPGMGPMRLEDVATGELLRTLPARGWQTWPLAFAPDDRLLASTTSDFRERLKGPPGTTGYRLRLWEIATASEVLSLPLTFNGRVAFSAHNRLLAVSAPGPEILVWDLARGRELRRFKGFDADVTWLAFAPDGRRLVSGLSDSTLLVWNVRPRKSGPAVKLGAAGVAKAWADLAGADAARAFRARGALATSPDEAVALLKDRLRPARRPDGQRLRRLLANLDSDRFAVREKAQAELEELGDLAEPALRRALADKPTLEVRRRVLTLLERLRGPARRPEVLRSLRAVAVLEDIATPAARKVLEDLAAGVPGVRLTREAKASLDRLDRGARARRE